MKLNYALQPYNDKAEADKTRAAKQKAAYEGPSKKSSKKAAPKCVALCSTFITLANADPMTSAGARRRTMMMMTSKAIRQPSPTAQTSRSFLPLAHDSNS